MNKNIKKFSVFFSYLAVFLLVFSFGVWVGRTQMICPVCQPSEVDFSLFWETLNQLKKNYVNPDKITDEQVLYGAVAGMVRALHDPYTAFFTPEETKIFLEDVQGSFEGVGMEIGTREGSLQVIAPLENTPAKKAGLRPGDKILKIGETITSELTAEEAVKLIRGPKGTEVNITVLRDGWDVPKDFSLVRDVIIVPSITLEIKDDIAYLKIHHFSEKAARDFSQAAIEILNSSTKGIVLDLRGNPGGYLEIAQNIAGWFLEYGQVVVMEDFGNGQSKEILRSEGNGKLKDYPTVVLINRGSASASEILAGSLRDNRDIKLIGETSFGKGTVQKLIENLYFTGSSLKVTIAQWLTPDGDVIDQTGLKPDIEIPFTEEDYQTQKDPQLEKAIEIMKQLQ